MWTKQGKHVRHPMHEFIADQIVANFFSGGDPKIFCRRKKMKINQNPSAPVHALDWFFHALDSH